MSRTRFIQHAGFPIVEMDFSRVGNAVDALAAIEEARLFVASQPLVPKLFTLVLVEGSIFNSQIIEALKNLSSHDRPWVAAGVVVGMSALHKVIYRVITTLTRRPLAAFDTAGEGKTWLAAQRLKLLQEAGAARPSGP